MATSEPSDDFAAALAAYEKETAAPAGRRGPRPGDTISGRIVSIGAGALFVDLGGKAEGMLDLVEVRDREGRITVAVGETIEARVAAIEDGTIVLRRTVGGGNARGAEARAELQQAQELRIPVEGLVSAVNKGGVEVQVAGVRAFCPMSQLDLRPVDDPTRFIGQRLQFRITRYESDERGRDNLVVSRRALLEDEQRQRAEAVRAKLQVGAVLPGVVTSLKDYGAFVDLGGVEGMLHVSQIGFQRVAHPKDALSVGQTIEVQILKLEPAEDPRRPLRISLSLRSLERDPWIDAGTRFAAGSRVAGKVVRVETFGAFVALAPGIEGLLHVSELGGGKRLVHARQAIAVGDTVEVSVALIDLEKRRLVLALAGEAPEIDPGGADSPPRGSPAPRETLGTFADLLKAGGKKKR